jgi:beta-glucosidase
MISTEQHIDELLSRMTLAERVALCHAGSKFAIAPLPHLGIPEFWMSDGPHGVRHEICRDSWDPVETDEDRSTYLPTGTALSATWNVDSARLFGTVLGAEARQRGKDIILGPGINIVRTPLCGRNFEYYGEDPLQIARMVVPTIQGIQSQGVAACVKHYVANNQELNRHGVDAQMDERTLREIYLPGFRAAVVEGKCWTVMGAYNLFRGQHCCHHEYLVNGILKGEWGFDGCYISDWAGTYSTLEAARYGLDVEMGTSKPYEEFYLARPFREAIERGELGEELVRDKARRVLRVMLRVGLFDAERSPGARNTPGHQQAALAVAREAIVLLKNEGNVLPLERNRIRRLVVMGDNATARHASGGHSSGVKAYYEVTPLQGLRDRLGERVEITYFQGYPDPDHAVESPNPEYLGIADEGAGTRGWKGIYFADHDFQKEAFRRADASLDFKWENASPVDATAPGQFSAKWETVLTPPESGAYEFILQGATQGGLFIDGEPIVHRFDAGPETVCKSVELDAGTSYQLKVELRPTRASLSFKLGWLPPWSTRGKPNDDVMMDAVKNADAVLFFGGLNHQYDLESADRKDMALHEGQNELISRVVDVNPRTIVVLVSGSPTEMPWVGKVPAIVQMWYAGMEGGHAIADVLLGDVNPSGKLPMTFPKALADSPAHQLGDYAADVCRYAEGIFVGYRWFDARGIEPLFPFGHGLSYTSFALSNFTVVKREAGVQIQLELSNTGRCSGAEVVQIYVGQPDCPVERPVRELKGFAKVFLQPGETRRVEIELSDEAFAYWSVEKKGWVITPGEFVIEVGVSSRRILAREVITWG